MVGVIIYHNFYIIIYVGGVRDRYQVQELLRGWLRNCENLSGEMAIFEIILAANGSLNIEKYILRKSGRVNTIKGF